MKFDIIIMNPPYNQTLHEKFFLKSFDFSSDNGCIVSVEPATWLLGKKKNKDICNNINLYKSDIESIHGSVFDADIQCQMTINHIDKSIKTNSVIFNNKEYKSTDDIFVFSTDNSLVNLYQSIQVDIQNDNVDNHLKRSWKDEQPKLDSFIVRVPAIRGHVDKSDDGKMDDFYTVISNDPKELTKTIGRSKDLYYNTNGVVKLYFELDSLQEANSLLKYFKTYFFRACLALKKHNLHLDSGEYQYVPWQDFNSSIFNSSISDIDKFLFEKYNISNDDVNHLRTILPNYYNI